MEIDTARLNDINILVVDDQTDVRKGLQKLISPLGCAVDIAASGEEAIELISQQSYDIVLTDIKMTGISGIDLLNWITKNQSGIDVVMISGFGTIEMAVQWFQIFKEIGIQNHLTIRKLENISKGLVIAS